MWRTAAAETGHHAEQNDDQRHIVLFGAKGGSQLLDEHLADPPPSLVLLLLALGHAHRLDQRVEDVEDDAEIGAVSERHRRLAKGWPSAYSARVVSVQRMGSYMVIHSINSNDYCVLYSIVFFILFFSKNEHSLDLHQQ